MSHLERISVDQSKLLLSINLEIQMRFLPSWGSRIGSVNMNLFLLATRCIEISEDFLLVLYVTNLWMAMTENLLNNVEKQVAPTVVEGEESTVNCLSSGFHVYTQTPLIIFKINAIYNMDPHCSSMISVPKYSSYDAYFGVYYHFPTRCLSKRNKMALATATARFLVSRTFITPYRRSKLKWSHPNEHFYRCIFPTYPSQHPRRCLSTPCCLVSPLSQDSIASVAVGRRNVITTLEERGLLEALTSDTLRTVCSGPDSPPLRVYCGFDPTAESLHLGNLLGIIVLSWFIRCGHQVVALIGGATGRVGDPSGKSLERPELDILALEKNTNGISETIRSILGRVGTTHDNSFFTVLNNYDWWKDVTLLDFLKDVGRFARVGSMMSKESVRKRLESEQGMSFTEFTYQLLQGYDFVHLFRKEGVSVQIGGSDQWGNITAGTDFIRRILQADGAYGLTFPLLLKSDGTKFGKSEDGAIWLSPTHLSPYKFYQYLFSVPDADVVRFLKILTFLSMEEIDELETDMNRPEYIPNTVQRKLAEEVTRFVHGEDGLNEALKATEALKPGSNTKLDSKAIEGITDDVPFCSLPYDKVLSVSLFDLAVSIGLVESKSAARRLLKQGGLYLNNCRVDSEGRKIEEDDIIDRKVILLSAGKKNKLIVRVSS